MSSQPLPDIPSSFDPAIHLHSDFHDAVQPEPPTHAYSDYLEALNVQQQEVIAEKNRKGIVIQHRHWRVSDVFRSEDDLIISPSPHPHIVQPPRHSTASPLRARAKARLDEADIRSSPPPLEMPYISSPVAYPASSSPAIQSPRKRRKLAGPRSPLQDVAGNGPVKARASLLMEESDDDEVPAKEQRSVHLTVGKSATRATPPQDNVIRTVGSLSSVAQSAPLSSPQYDTLIQDGLSTSQSLKPLSIRSAKGRSFYISERRANSLISYERLVASRSEGGPGQARQSYYGINIHQLMDEATAEASADQRRREAVSTPIVPSIEPHLTKDGNKHTGKTQMWTEKYRARKFTDLIGDERTHRSVLRWLKTWDTIVFPGSSRPKPQSKPGYSANDNNEGEPMHKKVLLLTGPPGLGKTTLAHVCAKQAGYEVQEINASDERSRDIVKGRIRDMVGTENVRGVNAVTADGTNARKAGRPVCVVVDEVDGAVAGSGGAGEGGFVKALIDLIQLDQKNSSPGAGASMNSESPRRKKKGDRFRLLRPLILVCNDVYHPSLRPLRQSSVAEVVYMRKPALNMVALRMQAIFEREQVPCETDGVRRLCEATWGVSTRKDGGTGSGTGEGDIRSIMVVAEWVATKLRAEGKEIKLTRPWVEQNLLNDLAHGGGAARNLGRGGGKEVVERVFVENAGFPKSATASKTKDAMIEGDNPVGVAEGSKRRAIERLREMVEASGETDRIVTDCFSSYPTHEFQDDIVLSKPNAAYEWLHFHDVLSDNIHGSQEWELYPYLSHSVLAFHHLFATPRRGRPSTLPNSNNFQSEEQEPAPFSGPQASYQAFEAQKQNHASLTTLREALSLPLTRIFRSTAELSVELLPYVLRMLSPEVKPVVINSGTKDNKGSTASVRRAAEKALVARAVNAMAAVGVRFERSRVEFDAANPRGTSAGWVYRMEPALDALGQYGTMGKKTDERVRFAVRQVLEMEWKKECVRIGEETRKRRMNGGIEDHEDDAVVSKGIAAVYAYASMNDSISDMPKPTTVKRDFFGRIISTARTDQLRSGTQSGTEDGDPSRKKQRPTTAGAAAGEEAKVWVSFHEGFSNAVRKPITLEELMKGI